MIPAACDVVVVGGGSAGLACAVALRQAGIDVVVLDAKPDAPAPAHADTPVWGAFRADDGAGELAFLDHGVSQSLAFGFLVIATGGAVQPAIMPGWTLPGVCTLDAAESIPAERRTLFAGHGPALLHAALARHRSGGAVTGIVTSAGEEDRASPELRRSGITLLRRHALRRIDQAADALLAVAAAIDQEGACPADKDRIFEVDAVCLGGSVAPRADLARLLGCAHDVGPHGPVVRAEQHGATSLPDVFVIGAAAGTRSEAAAAQGLLAAAAIARRAERPAIDTRNARRVVLRAGRARTKAGPASAALLPPAAETIICRCEALTLGKLQAAAHAQHIHDIATFKRLTRAGMGRCQGRDCLHHLPAILGLSPASEADLIAPQMPLRPIPIAALAVEQPEWRGHARALLPPDRTPDLGALPIREAATVIVGAGIAGLATAYYLAKAGHDVVVIDSGFANAMASGGNAGSLHVQLLSFDHSDGAVAGGSLAAATLPLQRDSVALWQELERETGAAFDIHITGGVMVAETSAQLRFLDAKTIVERRHGIDSHVIDAGELRRREPHLAQQLVGAAWCPQEGKINPLVATHAILVAARKLGARVFERTSLRSIERTGTGFLLHTSRTPLRAGRVVNAAGAFAARIGAMLGHDIPVFGAPLQMLVTEPGPALVRGLVAHAGRHLTLKQASNGAFLIGGGWTATLDPVHHRPRPLRDSLEGNCFAALSVLPALAPVHVVRSWAAMNIDIDGAPILGEYPREQGFFTAVTSNGYTLGPIVGRLTAEMILQGRPIHDVIQFSIERFQRDQ